MSGEKLGESIMLGWEDQPNFFSVKGHVDPDKAWKSIEQEIRSEYSALIEDYEKPVHAWARWTCCWYEGERAQTLTIYQEKSRGTFPVTVSYQKGWRP